MARPGSISLRRAFATLLAALALLSGHAAHAQEPPFSERLSGICSLGARASQGCDTIRARALADLTQPPFDALGRVNYAGGDLRSHCTGALVSQRLVLTAAHCLWNSARLRWIPPASLRFAHGYARGEARAVARVTRAILPPEIDPAQPAFRIDPSHDWALLVLETAPGGTPLPLFPGRFTNAVQGKALLPGYAGLTPHILTVATDCGRPLPVAGRLMAACSAMPGDSGAPLLWQDDEGTWVLGALSAVHADPGAFTTDFAPWFRLRDAIAAEIAAGN